MLIKIRIEVLEYVQNICFFYDDKKDFSCKYLANVFSFFAV